jgi:hypothetical protein
MSRPLLDAKAAGELVNVPASWLLAQARRDLVPHVRFGRYVRFDADALEAWWRGRQRGPVADSATVMGSDNSGRGATGIAPGRGPQEHDLP